MIITVFVFPCDSAENFPEEPIACKEAAKFRPETSDKQVETNTSAEITVSELSADPEAVATNDQPETLEIVPKEPIASDHTNEPQLLPSVDQTSTTAEFQDIAEFQGRPSDIDTKTLEKAPQETIVLEENAGPQGVPAIDQVEAFDEANVEVTACEDIAEPQSLAAGTHVEAIVKDPVETITREEIAEPQGIPPDDQGTHGVPAHYQAAILNIVPEETAVSEDLAEPAQREPVGDQTERMEKAPEETVASEDVAEPQSLIASGPDKPTAKTLMEVIACKETPELQEVPAIDQAGSMDKAPEKNSVDDKVATLPLGGQTGTLGKASDDITACKETAEYHGQPVNDPAESTKEASRETIDYEEPAKPLEVLACYETETKETASKEATANKEFAGPKVASVGDEAETTDKALEEPSACEVLTETQAVKTNDPTVTMTKSLEETVAVEQLATPETLTADDQTVATDTAAEESITCNQTAAPKTVTADDQPEIMDEIPKELSACEQAHELEEQDTLSKEEENAMIDRMALELVRSSLSNVITELVSAPPSRASCHDYKAQEDDLKILSKLLDETSMAGKESLIFCWESV